MSSECDENLLDDLARADGAMRDAYWRQKDLARSVDLAQSAIDRALPAVEMIDDPSIRDRAKSAIKTLAYNLASFVWPGWDEPGIKPTAAQLKAGLSAARLNLALAIELDRPPEKRRDAHWLLAAILIAHADFAQARQELERANAASPARMIDGYLALCEVLHQAPNAEQTWTAALGVLRDSNHPDDKEFLSQLLTARKVFGIHPTPAAGISRIIDDN